METEFHKEVIYFGPDGEVTTRDKATEFEIVLRSGADGPVVRVERYEVVRSSDGGAGRSTTPH